MFRKISNRIYPQDVLKDIRRLEKLVKITNKLHFSYAKKGDFKNAKNFLTKLQQYEKELIQLKLKYNK